MCAWPILLRSERVARLWRQGRGDINSDEQSAIRTGARARLGEGATIQALASSPPESPLRLAVVR
eukprot:11227296-Alexandrium_andersonii.AAC.1